MLHGVEFMTLNEYQRKTEATVIYPREYGVTYCALKLCSEAGEVAGIIGKEIRGDGNLDDKVLNELGDVLWYLARLAWERGYNLEQVACRNLAKLSDRQARGVLKGSGDER